MVYIYICLTKDRKNEAQIPWRLCQEGHPVYKSPKISPVRNAELPAAPIPVMEQQKYFYLLLLYKPDKCKKNTDIDSGDNEKLFVKMGIKPGTWQLQVDKTKALKAWASKF